MVFGFENIKEVLQTGFMGISALVIIIAAITYFTTLKQQYFTVINNCINKFQDLFITELEFKTTEKLKYLDLVNEQLFYIENYYIPSDVAAEWIDGMINFLPIITANQKEILTNPKSKFGYYSQDLRIELYPRITSAFILKINLEDPDLTKPVNNSIRQIVILSILKNIRKNGGFVEKIRYFFTIRKAKKFLKRIYTNQIELSKRIDD